MKPNKKKYTTTEIMKSDITDIAMVAIPARGSHCRFAISLGRAFPPSKGLLKDWDYLDVLGKQDVAYISTFFPEAVYRQTRSGRWARIQNFDDLKAAYIDAVL